LQFNDLRSDHIFLYNWQNSSGLFLLVGNFKEQNLQIFNNNYAIFHFKKFYWILFVVFTSFSHKTDKSEAKEPKAKSKKQKDLAVPKMI
jgi:hypothetical protein